MKRESLPLVRTSCLRPCVESFQIFGANLGEKMSNRRALSREQILELLDLDDTNASDSDASFSPGESDESGDSDEETVPALLPNLNVTTTEPVPSTK